MKTGGAVEESDPNGCLRWDSTCSVWLPSGQSPLTHQPSDSALLSPSVLPLDQLSVMTRERNWGYCSGPQGIWRELGLLQWDSAGWIHKKQSTLIPCLAVPKLCGLFLPLLHTKEMEINFYMCWLVTIDHFSSCAFLSRISKVSTNLQKISCFAECQRHKEPYIPGQTVSPGPWGRF